MNDVTRELIIQLMEEVLQGGRMCATATDIFKAFYFVGAYYALYAHLRLMEDLEGLKRLEDEIYPAIVTQLPEAVRDKVSRISTIVARGSSQILGEIDGGAT